ncbi:MAG: DinB family protein [Deltaproteobacteria bacterium]|nr:DinB family protein [Deltaproteobacteria bacterium]
MKPFDVTKSLTLKALKEFIAYASKTSDDKVNWKPSETARSVIEISQECLALANLLVVSAKENFSTLTEEKWQAEMNKAKGFTSLNDVLRQLRLKTNSLLRVFERFPPGKWSTTVKTGWGKMSIFEILWMHHNHLTYHLGQIAYIQTIYGDLEMHN